jgi:hypothetical protein
MRPLLPAFGIAILFSSARSGDEITFHPAEGSTVRRTVSVNGDFQLDDFNIVVDGQDMGQMLGGFGMAIEQYTHVVVEDVFHAMGDGRPNRLERTFETIESTMGMTMSGPVSQSQDTESSSELEGETVLFTWNEDEGDYDVAFDGGEGDPDLLDDLHEDMDVRALLPDGETAVDESWEVELTDLGGLMQPGGNLHYRPDGANLSEEDMKMFEDMFSDFGADLASELEGSCTCTYKGQREIDGTQVAEIEVEIEIVSTLSLASLAEQIFDKIAEQSGGEMPDISLDTAEMNIDVEGTGTLLWNVERGLMHSLQISADVIFGIDFAMSLEADGESHMLDASLEVAGTVEHEHEAE